MSSCPYCGEGITIETAEGTTEFNEICPYCSAPMQSNPSIETQNQPDPSHTDHAHLSENPVQPAAQLEVGEPPAGQAPTDEKPESSMSTEGIDTPSQSDHEQNESSESTLPTQEERTEANLQSLRTRGYVIQEDVHGLRLSGMATKTGGPRTDLSAYDIVRLAAELEGGIVPIEERIRCPKCDAVVSPNDTTCQWCSESLKS
ncbi:MAG: hypothetical protein GTO18_21310 [Anaerolineales bacterium]|nr:hypothetical protein [Anaerolineales bacterium]